MNQKIIDKIANLLARADENQNDCENERAIAMRQASSMLAKHGLTMSDITDQAERTDNMGALGRKEHTLSTRYVWESGVWSCVAKLNNCTVIRSPGRGKQRIWIIGRALHCTVSKQIAMYAVNSIKREAGKQGYSICSFGVGAWNGISAQVKTILAERQKGIIDNEPTSKETALAVINADKQALVETKKTVHSFFPRLSHSSYGYGGGDGDGGVSAGRSYGSSMNLNNQIGGQGQRCIT